MKLVLLTIGFINHLTFSGIFLLALIQLHGWEESFKNNWDSDVQAQYKQMISSFSRYSICFLVIIFIKLMSIDKPNDFLAACRKFHSELDRNQLIIIACFSFILVVFVCPSKVAESMAQYIIKVSVCHVSGITLFSCYFFNRLNILYPQYQSHYLI